ncbi:hypothetical protein H2199_002411 [Coniosporium tulheliwenetii]|uniref:Uncharacterized protein n=1 Tax=Coniosporium tulheliwenetii TaxID=3383036 RepID=A0ACC2ZFA1_9PEZI|nr:hypothetical protein H2199_002411 [Cladosporium sp. JES 115]
MADPVSIVASAAGIAAAGVQLSLSLYQITETVIHAPKEIGEIATEISLLATILERLGTVLEEGEDVYKPRLVSDTKSILSKFDSVQKEVQKLVSKSRKLKRLWWMFQSGKVKGLMSKIEALKSAMNLVLWTLQMATEQKKLDALPLEKDKPKRLRKVVESLLRANRQTVVKLQEEARGVRVSDMQYGYAAPGTAGPVQLIGGKPLDDTATWLYRLVFAPETLSKAPQWTARSISNVVTRKAVEGDANRNEAEEPLGVPPTFAPTSGQPLGT